MSPPRYIRSVLIDNINKLKIQLHQTERNLNQSAMSCINGMWPVTKQCEQDEKVTSLLASSLNSVSTNSRPTTSGMSCVTVLTQLFQRAGTEAVSYTTWFEMDKQCKFVLIEMIMLNKILVWLLTRYNVNTANTSQALGQYGKNKTNTMIGPMKNYIRAANTGKHLLTLF